MTSPAITVDAADTLKWAAEQMAGRRINRLPVIEKGVLVGIVTRADVVRAFVRSDAGSSASCATRSSPRPPSISSPRRSKSRSRAVSCGSPGASTGVRWPRPSSTSPDGSAGIVGVESDLTWEIDDVARPPQPPELDVLRTLRPH